MRLVAWQWSPCTCVTYFIARDEDSGQKVCSQLAADGCNAKFIPLDVTSKESIFNAAENIREDYEGLDILINNAGIMYSSSKVRNVCCGYDFH